MFVPEGKLKEFLKLVDGYAASVVLTYEADPQNEQKLKDVADVKNGSKFRGPVRKTKLGKVKLQFTVP